MSIQMFLGTIFFRKNDLFSLPLCHKTVWHGRYKSYKSRIGREEAH